MYVQDDRMTCGRSSAHAAALGEERVPRRFCDTPDWHCHSTISSTAAGSRVVVRSRSSSYPCAIHCSTTRVGPLREVPSLLVLLSSSSCVQGWASMLSVRVL